jgi:threonyl-tRNA synthetase
LWLAPVQVELLTIADRHASYAETLSETLRSRGIRTDVNVDNEKIGYKIRSATIRKVPYLVIIGDKEMAEEKVAIRKRTGENIGPFSLDELIDFIMSQVRDKVSGI